MHCAAHFTSQHATCHVASSHEHGMAQSRSCNCNCNCNCAIYATPIAVAHFVPRVGFEVSNFVSQPSRFTLHASPSAASSPRARVTAADRSAITPPMPWRVRESQRESESKKIEKSTRVERYIKNTESRESGGAHAQHESITQQVFCIEHRKWINSHAPSTLATAVQHPEQSEHGVPCTL